MLENKIKEFTANCQHQLISKQKFIDSINAILDEESSPVERFLFVINCNDPLEKIYIGDQSLENNPDIDHINNIWNDINNNSISTIKMYIKLKHNRIFSSYNIFEDLLKAFWRENTQRQAKTLLLPDGDGDMPNVLNTTIKETINEGKTCAVLYADIDKFKNINDTYGHDTADAVISKVAIIIEKYSNNSIPIHSHGDEFAILHSSECIDEILLVINNIREDLKHISVKHKDPGTNVEKVISLEVGLSFGMCIINKSNYDSQLEYTDYLGRAEKALVPDGPNSKQRGKIRIYLENDKDFDNIVNDISFKNSLIKAKINALSKNLFGNIWLNFLSKYIQNVSNLEIENFQELFEKVIKVIEPDFSNNIVSLYSDNNNTHFLSIVDIFVAFLSGCIANKTTELDINNIKVKYDVVNHKIKVLIEGIEVINYKKDDSILEEFDILSFKSLPKILHKKPVMNGRISNTILVVVGDNYDKTYHEIFQTIINVDNRPITGGGLPDFWEAAIAHLIHHISNNENIKYVFFIGDENKETKIYTLLKDINNNSVHDKNTIAYKTGYDSSTINSIFAKLENHVYFDVENTLITDVFEKEFENNNTFDILLIDYNNASHRKGYLEQTVNLNHFKLDELDGCKGESLRKIYPVVINNMRATKLVTYTDLNHKSFKELIDYKIILTKPLEDKIPWFYEKDKKSFDDYFQYNFLTSKGAFYDKLNAADQENIVVNHIVEYLQQSKHNQLVYTRRATIILNNNIQDNKLEPVGLVSVRLFHTLDAEGTVNINFTYVWRTVEVIVGLPYSLYGSIEYSQYLLAKIKNKLEGFPSLDVNIKKMKIGKVTYIAQSLHMFTDSYSENIAKNIVNEAII